MVAASSSERRRSSRLQQAREIISKVLRRRANGDVWTDSQIIAENPGCLPELADELKKLQRISTALAQFSQQQCLSALERLQADWLTDSVVTATDELPTSAAGDSDTAASLPASLGRYRIRKMLGQGGFGQVYLGWDGELQRQVAIKVAHARRVKTREDARAYLSEARVIASLDHPGIVPVYDVQRDEDGTCYFVSKLVVGANLAEVIRDRRPSFDETCRLVIVIAEALHYAHEQGVIHRDIKPANILIANDGTPFVSDFGLALRDEDAFDGHSFAGTPAYMSPEQARGEAHRVDGRSDIFSLGVVIYELLTGRKPFREDSYAELLDCIIHQTPQAPRQIDASIPEELERICLKACAKRAADRYATASELADDLRHFLRAGERTGEQVVGGSHVAHRPAIVPKGLRAFDSNDSEFFLQLVPGPRDRHGLPECVRQWKHRIEARDLDETFAIGVVYGPSGCGKSSFVRAGLLPRLDETVHTVYLEASGEETEARLLGRLRRSYAGLEDGDLSTALATIRRGQVLPSGHKLLLVIDQVEQWLHGKTDEQRRGLVEALRQCDGDRLQCLLLVRDDFWLALSRFMAELEVDLSQRQNTSLVDLFDPLHAAKVLTEFGRAFGRLPQRDLSPGEQQFIDESIAGLIEDGKVIPVRLALFAEMFKGKAWTTTTLRQLGGTSGVGLAFLEETFSARTADPRNRVHEKAARAVLDALMPEPGSNIRGHTRSYPELLDISGYGQTPAAFKELMRILDGETRLLTPADSESALTDAVMTPGRRGYQLTHDYLVPSLREWLNQRQRATRAGRAELRLAERSAMWNSHPELRQLPSPTEWLTISTLTRPSQWTGPQRRMMRAALRYYATVIGCFAAFLLMFLLVGSELATQVRDTLVKFRASTATVWLALGQEDAIWPLLKHDADPTLRTDVIHRIHSLVVSSENLVPSISQQPDISTQRAMLLVAGELAGDSEQRENGAITRASPTQPMLEELVRLHREATDAGVRAAAEWALRRYGFTLEADRFPNLALDTLEGERQWYVASGGHTMMVIHGGAQFTMGTPDAGANTSDESPRRRMIRRSFSIAHRETTVAQFERFLRETQPAARPQRGPRLPADHPCTSVTWFEAANYCNWLSSEAGLPEGQWCYLPTGDGLRIAPDFTERRGYRLPTEAEWEYACRAGAATERFFGREVKMLQHYAVFEKVARGSPNAGGWRKPNDFGLFDMLGNAAEWCHDRYLASGSDSPDDSGVVSTEQLRVVRGGSFRDSASKLRCAARNKELPDNADLTVGFRVARSYP